MPKDHGRHGGGGRASTRDAVEGFIAGVVLLVMVVCVVVIGGGLLIEVWGR